MTEREMLELRNLELELEANGVMSAIYTWEVSFNTELQKETIMALKVQARILMARAAGIRDYLDRDEEPKDD